MSILTENDKQIMQPSTIKIPLMNHQKTIVCKMIEIEDVDEYDIKYKSIYSDDIADGKMQTNIGILGDKVGAGKTLDVITLISAKPVLKERLTVKNGFYCSNIRIKQTNTMLNVNLVVVPQKLVPQWDVAFKNATNLNVHTITTTKKMNEILIVEKEIYFDWADKECQRIIKNIDINKISKFNVVLIGDTMFKKFIECSNRFNWTRIFIDEIDTIKLPKKLPYFKFNFLWLITGTPTGLIGIKKPFLTSLFSNDKNCVEYITFKNKDEFIDQSIELPQPKRFQIKCLTPKEISIIKNLIPSSVLQMINAGNTNEAIKTLNCNVDTNDNIFQVITKNLSDSIANKKIELDAEQKKHYPIAHKKEQEHKIKNIENSLKKLQTKYEDIKKKIYELNDDYCPVCMSSFTNPAIVNCCKNCFCFECLAVSLGELKNNKCPYCTQNISMEDIHLINNDTIELKKTNITDLKDKMDVLIELIQKKPNGSFMIFANFAETFDKIQIKLNEIDVKYHILKGQASTVDKYINDFKEKKVQVLMLNAQYFGAGMNLQMTTDLVIYHRFTKEMEEQIIGRAQRLGRKTPLNVYYLIHENESSELENKFKFEDINNINYLDWISQQEETLNNKNEETVNYLNINMNDFIKIK